MAYRTWINGVEIFGNNEYHDEWIDFIKSKGIEIDEDGLYESEIDDVQGIFEVVDKITRRLINERHKEVEKGEKTFRGEPLRELTDFSDYMWLDDKTPILMFNEQVINHAYCFYPWQVYQAVLDKIERVSGLYEKDGIDWTFFTYKIKDNETIKVRGG